MVAQVSREYDLKAVFLYNFATFIEWPTTAFPSEEAPFVIGLLGEDPFGTALDDVVRGERARQHPIVVKRLRRVDDSTGCHLLFICPSESRRLKDVLREIRGRPVLTVADTPGFAEAGGMIGFSTRESRVRLNINIGAVRAAELSVSSKLLELARLIDEVAENP